MSGPSFMKVMLVDDELLALEDLRTLIPWQSNGCEIVAMATDGKKALELFRQYEPHLMIVDVRMPIMDGIELLRQLSLYDPEKYPKIILLTAYKDFGYAQKAIEYRVSNYLLKHMLDEHTLLEEVLKVRREWVNEQHHTKVVHRQLLKHWIAGSTTAVPTLPGRNATLDMARTIGLIVFEADFPFSVTPYLDEPEFPITMSFMEQLDWSRLGIRHPIDVVEGNNGQCCLIVSFKDTHSQRHVHETLQHLASYVLKQYNNTYQATLSAAITHSFGMKALPELYREAAHVLRYKWFIGKGTFMDTSQMRPEIRRQFLDTPDLDHDLKAVLGMAYQADSEGLEQAIQRLFQKMKEPYWNLHALYKSVGGLLDILSQLDEAAGGLPDREAPNRDFQSCGLFGINDIRDWFIARFKHTLAEQDLSGNRYSYKTIQAMDYIRKHYREEVNVRTVSQALHISSSYLHQLFKKEIGQTFVEFLTDYRINMAKELLRDDTYKIYEIAEITGFNTSQYFSSVFHRSTGFSPQTYKNKLSGTRDYEN